MTLYYCEEFRFPDERSKKLKKGSLLSTSSGIEINEADSPRYYKLITKKKVRGLGTIYMSSDANRNWIHVCGHEDGKACKNLTLKQYEVERGKLKS